MHVGKLATLSKVPNLRICVSQDHRVRVVKALDLGLETSEGVPVGCMVFHYDVVPCMDFDSYLL